MLNRPFKSAFARAAIFALVLALAIPFVSGGLTSAQEAADDPCDMDGTSVTCSYDENSTDAVADFSATDPEQEGIEWAVEGLDAEFFDITGGVLTFKKSPNFEMPADNPRAGVADDVNVVTPDIDETVVEETGVDNDYLVTVVATELLAEGQDPPALWTPLDVTVTVKDVDEDGSISLNRIQPQVLAPLTATLNDPDRGSANTDDPASLVWLWSIPKVSRPVTNNDDHWQPATPAPGVTQTDDEQTSVYTPGPNDATSVLRVMVTYNDQQGNDGKTAYMLSYRAVRVAPTANQAPSFDTTASFDADVPEDTAVGTAVGTPVTASDPNDGDTLSYELSGTDATSFKIDIATGQITLAAKLDHELGTDGDDGVYQLTVTAIDPSNNVFTDGSTHGPVEVTITATDVNEAPTVGDSTAPTPGTTSVAENSDIVVLGTFTGGDQDAADTGEGNLPKLTLDGDDADAFELTDDDRDDAAAGNRTYELRFKESPNFEMPTDANQDNSYKVTIVATDKKDLTGTKDLTIKVTNVDEPGTVSLSRIQPGVGQEITASLMDPDGGINDMKWQWARSGTGADGSFNDIDGATSASYTPEAKVEDNPATVGINEEYAGDEGQFLRAMVTYRDAQSIPDVESTTEVEEGRRGVDTDADDNVDMRVLEISENAVRAVPDVNNPPVFASASMMREVNENETENAGDPVTADDADDDSLTYSISGGADMDAFGIVPGSGQITVEVGTELDAEGAQTSYEVEVKADDPFGDSDTTMVTLRVMNVNEAPDFKAEDPDGYDENGTGPVATFTATDPEGAGVDWSLKGTDAASFSIDANGVLTFKKSPNYEMPGDILREAVVDVEETEIDETVALNAAGNNEYVLVVQAAEQRAADAEGETKSSSLEITVTVKNVEEPGSLELTRVQPQASAEIGTEFSDPDGPSTTDGVGNAITVTWLWSVPKVSRPEIDNDNHWTAGSGADGNTAATYTPDATNDPGSVLRVKASYADGEGPSKVAYMLSYYAVRAVPAGDNQIPDFDDNADATRSIAEDAATGAIVGAPVTATDPNADDGGKLTYTLTVGDDAGFFKINKMTGLITVNGELDHEAGSTDGVYNIVVNVFDPSLGTDTFGVAITATDVNEAPTVVLVTTGGETETLSVPENHAVMNVEVADGEDIVSDPLGTYTKTDFDVGDGTDGETANASQVKLSLSGDDKDAFKLGDPDDTGNRELRFAASPNFESPVDANQDNDYKVTIVATDKKGLTGTRELTIEVTNLDEAGEVKLSTIQPGVGQEITAMLTDPDMGVNGARWQWASSGTRGGTFTDIRDATSASYTPKMTVPDNPLTEDVNEAVTGDEGRFLRARVTYRDNQSIADVDDVAGEVAYEEGRRGINNPATTGAVGDPDGDAVGEAFVQAISDNAVREVPDVNSAPEFAAGITREVKENTKGPDGKVGDPVKADDADDDVLTYTISGGADMGSFTIDDETGQIKVGKDTMLDFEGSQTTYVIEVKAADPFGMSDTTTVTIMVINVNEPPDLTLVVDEPVTPPVIPAVVVTGDSAVDYEENGTGPVATYTSSVADVIWSLSGPDMDDFTISGGVLEFTSPPDWESPTDADTSNDYMVTVAATDGTTTGTVSVTVTVTDMDEGPPTVEVTGTTAVDYEENGTGAVGTYTSSEAGATWSLSGEDMDDFSISSDGVLEFTSPPDYEAATDANADNVYMVTVTAMAADAGDGSLEVAVTVTDMDEETPFDPLSYDADDSGAIERPEVIQAIRDYFADTITRDDVIAVIRLYFGNGS